VRVFSFQSPSIPPPPLSELPSAMTRQSAPAATPTAPTAACGRGAARATTSPDWPTRR
jgi:hypothetical protein